jgi:hypothetical protein
MLADRNVAVGVARVYADPQDNSRIRVHVIYAVCIGEHNRFSALRTLSFPIRKDRILDMDKICTKCGQVRNTCN